MPYEISSHASSTSLSTAPNFELGYYISRGDENQVLFISDAYILKWVDSEIAISAAVVKKRGG